MGLHDLYLQVYVPFCSPLPFRVGWAWWVSSNEWNITKVRRSYFKDWVTEKICLPYQMASVPLLLSCSGEVGCQLVILPTERHPWQVSEEAPLANIQERTGFPSNNQWEIKSRNASMSECKRLVLPRLSFWMTPWLWESFWGRVSQISCTYIPDPLKLWDKAFLFLMLY